MNTTQLQLNTLIRPWIDEALPKAMALIKDMGEFEAYDLHAMIDAPPVDNYWGSLVARLKRAGAIREVGFRASKNPRSNKSRVVIWVHNEKMKHGAIESDHEK